MKHNCKKSLSLLLVVCMLISLFAGLTVTAGAFTGVSGGETITESNTYEIESGSTGIITVNPGLTVTLVGSGDYATRYNGLKISVGEGTELTIQDFYADQGQAASVIDFVGNGKLNISGTNQIDNDGGLNNAVIHVGPDKTLTLGGDGCLYGYKSALCAYIGGNSNEANGNIVINSGHWFIKGTKTGAIIGGDSTAVKGGNITINGGELYLKGVARGALIGGSNQGLSGDVYINGGLLELYEDFTGPAIGAGNVANAGKLYVNGGSVKTVKSANSLGTPGAPAISWDTVKATNAADYAVLPVDVSGVAGNSITIKVDGADFYTGGKYTYVTNEVKNPTAATTTGAVSDTASNWLSNDVTEAVTAADYGDSTYPAKSGSSLVPENNLYLALSKNNHTVSVNGTETVYYWDSVTGTFKESADKTITVKLDGADKKTYSASDLNTLASTHSDTLYFSGIGGGKRTIDDARTLAAATRYVTVTELLTGAIGDFTTTKYADYDIIFTATDGNKVTMTVEDLLGTTRYYYPAWLTAGSYTDDITGTVAEGAVEVPAVLSLCGYTASSDDNGLDTVNETTNALKGCFANPSLLISVCDTARAPRLMLGQKSGGCSTEKNLGGLSNSNVVSIELKAPVSHGITKASTTHGSFTVSSETSIKGKTITITTEPAEGYTVGSVLAGTTAATMTAQNTYTFTMPDADVTVSVTFANSSYVTAGADTSWYNTTADSFVLTDGADLLGFAAIVNDEAAGITQDSFAGKTITLGADIDLSGISWNPIGGSFYRFAGTFDGANKTISGLSVNQTGSYAGLFGYNKGTVKNLTLSGTVAASGIVDFVGSVVGYNGGTVTGVVSSVTVTAEKAYNVGGIAGFNDGGIFASTVSKGQSTATNTGNTGKIENCACTGNVTGYEKVGGIAGENSGTVKACYASGIVDGTCTGSKSGIGGIVGRNGNNNNALETGVIDSCYFTGTVGRAGQKWVGGIAGFNNGTYGNPTHTPSTVTNCYMAGTLVAGVSTYNAIIGQNEGTASNNYTLSTITGSGSEETETGIAKTEQEMKSSALVASLNAGGTTWKSGCTRPALYWETVKHNYDGGGCSDCGTVDPSYVTPSTPQAPTSTVWDGESVDVSWYFENKTATSYTISTAAELAGVAALVNGLVNSDCTVYTGKTVYTASKWNNSAYVKNGSGTNGANNKGTDDYSYGIEDFDGVTLYLGADINMSAGNYMPIGGQYLMEKNTAATKIDASFNGTLDGCGHNVTIECDRHCSTGNYGDGQSIGLVGRLGCHDSDVDNGINTLATRPTVCNLAVYGSVKGNRSVGGVVGKIGKSVDGGLIENCANFATVTGTDKKGTGGIVGAGWNGGTIRNCYNAGAVINTAQFAVAGISGSNEAAIINCYNRGSITGPTGSVIAAIASDNGGSYENCYWLDTSAEVGVYTGSAVDTATVKTESELKSAETITALGSAFATDSGNVNAGYPVLSWQVSTKINTGKAKKSEETETETEQALPFTDVSGHWATDAITFAYNNNLFSGTSDTTFNPDASMTRAMLVTVLYRMAGCPAVTQSNTFTDVEGGQWYTDAVIWAKANGFVNGYDDTHFGTNDNVTREQMVSMLMRYAEKTGCDVAKANELTSFTDSTEISSWALSAVKWANAAGLINGRTETTIAPHGTATRAEVAAILMRFIQNETK